MKLRIWTAALGLALAVPSVVRAEMGAPRDAHDAIGSYPLDDTPRTVPARGRFRCPEVKLMRYRGDVIRYHKPVLVHVAFAERLRRFEEVVAETAREVYGRAPIRIRHLGTYNCRRIRGWPTFLSEHALGNGIDVEGFDFAPARSRAQRAAAPPSLRGAFQVRVARHWNATGGIAAHHARFLRLLTERLVGREDIFRVLLGPAYPGHQNHFHFDVSPWRIVEL